MKINSTFGFVMFGVVIMALIIGYAVYKGSAPSVYDDFAQCITDKGGQMFGTYWCGNCANQKDRFGSAFDKIDYTECSSPGPQNFDYCPEVGRVDSEGNKIDPQGVPYWTNTSGEYLVGDRPLETVAEFFDCELPE